MDDSDSGYVFIHKHIDNLPMFCNWDIDVVVIFLLFLEAGIYLANDYIGTIVFIVLGCSLSWGYSKIKSNSIKGFYRQVMYMLGFRHTKHILPSYKRHFLGA